ncbi:MAG: outer membrane protein assembly factor BamD [Planctomycetota bacterium]|nr:outer membrane protein assembly factor BamD [Planctomycetota bacterium]
MNSIRNLWIALASLSLLWGCQGPGKVAESRVTPQDRISAAQEALARREYAEVLQPARLAYGTAEEKDAETRGEALYLEAEALFHLDEYTDAHWIYERLLEKYPGHIRFRPVVEREYQIALLLLEGKDPTYFLFFRIGRQKVGIEILERIVNEFPAERFAEDGQFRIATYYFEKREFDEAKEEYARLISNYPASKWAAISLYRQGVCVMHESNGSMYDATPLREARKVFKAYLKRFPRGDQLREAGERIAEIDEMLASEEYDVALAYLRQGRPLAAIVYLRSIVENYSTTTYAQLARRTLSGIGPPAEPDEKG